LKYKYPYVNSSDPSPENITVTSVFLLIYLLNIYIGKDALMVVTSNDSVIYTTSSKLLKQSDVLIINDLCTDPIWFDNFSAYNKSGLFSNPIENVYIFLSILLSL